MRAGLCLLLLLSIPLSWPEVAPAAPVPKARKPVIELEGTVWVSEGETGFGAATYKFQKDGVLEYQYGGTTWRNGTWKFDGQKFEYELNQRYYVYVGEVNGDVIEGKATNKPGGSWTYKLKPKTEK